MREEVDLCSAKTSSTTRAAIETCLASHYTELSPSCQCFVHHVMGDAPAAEAATARAAGAAPARAPVVRTVVDAEADDEEEGEEGEGLPRKMKMRCVLGMVVAWGILAIIMRRLCILSERKSKGAMQQVCFITVIMLLAGVWPLLFFSVPLLMLCFAYTCVPARDRSAVGKKKVAAAGPCPETVAGTVVPLTIETSPSPSRSTRWSASSPCQGRRSSSRTWTPPTSRPSTRSTEPVRLMSSREVWRGARACPRLPPLCTLPPPRVVPAPFPPV